MSEVQVKPYFNDKTIHLKGKLKSIVQAMGGLGHTHSSESSGRLPELRLSELAHTSEYLLLTGGGCTCWLAAITSNLYLIIENEPDSWKPDILGNHNGEVPVYRTETPELDFTLKFQMRYLGGSEVPIYSPTLLREFITYACKNTVGHIGRIVEEEIRLPEPKLMAG